MKRLVLLAVIIIGISKVSAQYYDISVYGEPHVSWITSNSGNVTNNGTVMQLNAGIELDLYFAQNYAFSLGICMQNTGGKLLYTTATQLLQDGDTLSLAGGSPMKHSLHYVGLPIGLKLKSEELGYTTFYFHSGLIPMFSTGANTSSESLGIPRKNISSEINLFNLNYFIELGIEYRLGGNTALKVGMKWSAGIIDVTKNDYSSNNLSSVGLLLGVLF